jgi:asparagine synthetase B (glutamine-hydrolysing)
VNDDRVFTTDRFGSLHAYLRQSDHQVSDYLTAPPGAKLDWQAITTWFAFGYFLNDRTWFEDVRILRPASRYRISDDGTTVNRQPYWTWHHTVNADRTYDETVDEYHRLLEQAVGRCARDARVLLPISGGLDSRSLAAVMPDDVPVQSYSYGYSQNSVETAIAAEVARVKNLPFTAHVIRPYLFDRLREVVIALHGCQDVTQTRQVCLSDWLAAHGDVVLTGLWGDVWCDQMGLADGLPPDTTLTCFAYRKFRKRGSDWLLKHVAGPQLGLSSLDEWLMAQIDAGLKAYEHIEDLDFRLKAYKTDQWGFRWSNASLRAFELGAEPRVPYYDSDLVDFFCTVPTAFVRDRRLQIDHLKRYAPDLARVRWQTTNTNLYQIRQRGLHSLPRRAYTKARRFVRNERLIQRNWELQFLSPAGRAGLEQWLLRGGLKLHAFVSPSRISELIDDLFASPRADNGYTVSMLLTFSAWLEVAC